MDPSNLGNSPTSMHDPGVNNTSITSPGCGTNACEAMVSAFQESHSPDNFLTNLFGRLQSATPSISSIGSSPVEGEPSSKTAVSEAPPAPPQQPVQPLNPSVSEEDPGVVASSQAPVEEGPQVPSGLPLKIAVWYSMVTSEETPLHAIISHQEFDGNDWDESKWCMVDIMYHKIQFVHLVKNNFETFLDLQLIKKIDVQKNTVSLFLKNKGAQIILHVYSTTGISGCKKEPSDEAAKEIHDGILKALLEAKSNPPTSKNV